MRTEKNSKERTYFALISRDDYLSFETGNFMKYFHNNSFSGFLNALFGDNKLGAEDLDEINVWLKKKR